MVNRTKTLALLVMIQPLSACFSLDEPVIEASEATQVPGLIGDYLTLDGDVVSIHEPQGNEYPVVITADGETHQVTLRAVQFGSLFLAQLHDLSGAEPGASVMFLSPRGGSIFMHVPTLPVDDLAERHGLRLTGGTKLTGPRAGIRGFLEDVVALPMSSAEVLMTK